MATYYRPLKFPKKFLRENIPPGLFDFSGAYDLFPFQLVLDEELLEFLSGFPLEPDFVAVFNNKNQQGSIESRMIHSDIFFDRDKKWKSIFFGVHYELEDTQSRFHWWDMLDAEQIYPDPANERKRHPRFDRLNGIHYGIRGRQGTFQNSILLDSVDVNGPMLVRTDIPHSVSYHNPNRTRLAFSLRFKTNFQSWDEVSNFFQDYDLETK